MSYDKNNVKCETSQSFAKICNRNENENSRYLTIYTQHYHTRAADIFLRIKRRIMSTLMSHLRSASRPPHVLMSVVLDYAGWSLFQCTPSVFAKTSRNAELIKLEKSFVLILILTLEMFIFGDGPKLSVLFTNGSRSKKTTVLPKVF